ncbi:unnamed protein product [Lactuca saligna]|uniref:DUF674 domain-containing protein n=1 Tax=Lactuca saligna TaxID=75948 RepID=A0AA36DWQ6_LACSI|nr:unnamed protein product [Lactuca saligna]
MADDSSSSKVSLKLLINSKTKQVLFAEANKEFVDFLFYILSLPVGTVIRLLSKNSMVGSLGNLYDSIENLSDMYMQPNQSKDSVLNPNIVNYGANEALLLPPIDFVPKARKFYKCPSHNTCVTDNPTAVCPSCNSKMSTEVAYVKGSNSVTGTVETGGFVKGVVTYMVMDDLEVKPMSTISSLTMLNKFNVKEVGGLEEKVVSLEMKKASMLCKNVLTSVFLA